MFPISENSKMPSSVQPKKGFFPLGRLGGRDGLFESMYLCNIEMVVGLMFH